VKINSCEIRNLFQYYTGNDVTRPVSLQVCYGPSPQSHPQGVLRDPDTRGRSRHPLQAARARGSQPPLRGVPNDHQ